jgi:hypothetical protein
MLTWIHQIGPEDDRTSVTSYTGEESEARTHSDDGTTTQQSPDTTTVT